MGDDRNAPIVAFDGLSSRGTSKRERASTTKYDLAFERIAVAAPERGCRLEIDATPDRLDHVNVQVQGGEGPDCNFKRRAATKSRGGAL